MRVFDQVPTESLERRETHLILLACSAIIVLEPAWPYSCTL